MMSAPSRSRNARHAGISVELYWLPLGAGGALPVRYGGRLYEAVAARHDHRPPLDLYHSALRINLHGDLYVVEMAPVWSEAAADRGVVAEGPVGSRRLGRSRLFRYEIRRWRHGRIPDLVEAVASPQRLSTDACRARHLLDVLPEFPCATWGRDELATGDMWNSNSLISWALAVSGHPVHQAVLPPHGRAPGWTAGLIAARRRGLPSAADAEHRRDLRSRPEGRAPLTGRPAPRWAGVGAGAEELSVQRRKRRPSRSRHVPHH
jgi:hypothetical protein